MKIKEENKAEYITEAETDVETDDQEISFRRAVDAEGFARITHHMTLDLRISDGAYRTYADLLKYAQNKQRLFGGVARLAEDRGVSRQTISSHLAQLEALGFITRERRFRQTSLTYIEDVEAIYAAPDTAPVVKNTLPPLSSKLDDSGKANLTTEEEQDNKKKSKKNKISRDARTDHPAIKAILSVTGKNPSKDVYDSLIAVLGESPDIEKLAACFKAWRLRDYRPTNFAWATDWYVNGIKQNGNGTGGHVNEPRGMSGARAIMEDD